MFLLPLIFVGLCSSILAAYPSYQNAPQYAPSAPLYPQLNEFRNGPQYQFHKESQYNPNSHLNTPPPYLVYSQASYKLANISNVNYQAKGHDFILGTKGPRDELLLHSIVHKKPRFWRSYVSKEIIFPPLKSFMKVNITQVSAYDLGKNGTGGFVKVSDGGFGQDHVSLLFTNQKDQPIYYELNIYGKKL